jgi:hypothetical protein
MFKITIIFAAIAGLVFAWFPPTTRASVITIPDQVFVQSDPNPYRSVSLPPGITGEESIYVRGTTTFVGGPLYGSDGEGFWLSASGGSGTACSWGLPNKSSKFVLKKPGWGSLYSVSAAPGNSYEVVYKYSQTAGPNGPFSSCG